MANDSLEVEHQVLISDIDSQEFKRKFEDTNLVLVNRTNLETLIEKETGLIHFHNQKYVLTFSFFSRLPLKIIEPLEFF